MKKGKWYSNLSLTLPNKFEWCVDFKVSSKSGSEDRVWLTPTEISGSNEQPPYALGVQFDETYAVFRNRRNGSTINLSGGTTYSANTYTSFKLVVDGSDLTGYINGNLIGTGQETWIGNYSSWWFAYSFWKRPNITGTLKNLKIKTL